MSLVCKTLVLVENKPTLELVKEAFQPPKYELVLANSLDEATSCTIAHQMDLFIVDSRLHEQGKVKDITETVPTLVLETDFESVPHPVECSQDEINKIRMAAGKLLRKNYFNWILDALEYTS